MTVIVTLWFWHLIDILKQKNKLKSHFYLPIYIEHSLFVMLSLKFALMLVNIILDRLSECQINRYQRNLINLDENEYTKLFYIH